MNNNLKYMYRMDEMADYMKNMAMKSPWNGMDFTDFYYRLVISSVIVLGLD